MKLLFALRLALRYLKPHRTFLSVITVISIFGVIVACLALTIIMPVMAGFEKSIKERLIGSNPHAIFKYSSSKQEGGVPLLHWQEYIGTIEEFDQVKMAFPVVEGQVFMEFRDAMGGIRRAPQLMSAIDPEDNALIDELEGSLGKETYPTSSADLSKLPSTDNLDGVCLLSSVAAQSMGLNPGETITLYSPSNFEQVVEQVASLERPTLASRAGEQLLDLRAQFLASLRPAALAQDEAWPEADTPLGEAQALALPAAFASELYEVLHSLKDKNSQFGQSSLMNEGTNSPGDLAAGEAQKPRNRVSDQEKLSAATAALDRFLRQSDDQQFFIYEATRENSPLADVKNLLQELGTEPTAAQEQEQMRQLQKLILPKTLEIIGIFEGVGFSASIVVPLHIGQSLYSLDEAVHGIGVRVENAAMVKEYQPRWEEQIQQNFGKQEMGLPRWLTETWEDRYGNLIGQIENERVMMYIILFFIMLVASFCICSNLVTTTVLKRREMGLLKAFGSPVWQISGIFVFQGLIVGAIGTISGIGLGWLILWQRNNILDWVNKTWGLNLFPADVYGLDGGIPAVFTIEQTLIVAIGAFFFSTLAALPPALMVAYSQPAASLRSQGS